MLFRSVELSLHLANLQSLYKENTLLLTNKKFESCDDEILLKELFPKKPRELSKMEEEELDKTIKYSGTKLLDVFNIGKSIWNLAFDNIHISLRKNKENLSIGKGYIYHLRREDGVLFLWEYEIKKEKKDDINSKTFLNILYQGSKESIVIGNLIRENSTWRDIEGYDSLPFFEIKASQLFPLEETFIPMMKRKLLTYFFQVLNTEISKNFDSQIEL